MHSDPLTPFFLISRRPQPLTAIGRIRIPKPDVAVASWRPRAGVSVVARAARGFPARIRVLQLCVTQAAVPIVSPSPSPRFLSELQA